MVQKVCRIQIDSRMSLENAMLLVDQKCLELCSEFDTLEAQRKIFVDHMDYGAIHESTGLYVTKSTPGFFPSRTIPAFKICSLFSELIHLYRLSEAKQPTKNLVAEISKVYWEAFHEGFDNSGEKKKKKSSFKELRKDVKNEAYNDILEEVAAAAQECHANSTSNAAKQIFPAIYYLAVIASDDYGGDDHMQDALKFVSTAISLKFHT